MNYIGDISLVRYIRKEDVNLHLQYKVFMMNNLELMSTEENNSNIDQNEDTSHIEPTNESSMPFEESETCSDSASKEASEECTESACIEETPAAEVGKQNAHRQHFEKFLSDMSQFPDNETKLQFAIDFMEASIGQVGSPHFKSFWEARSLCLELFKENISPVVRGILWNKYNELSKEARRLKEILDEQSAFAVEQIEIAISALEADILSIDEHLQKASLIDFGMCSKVLADHLPSYQQWQQRLNLLNTQASRINALRKELIRTEMRVRQKNKFFQRLSAAGDKVFPQRKELIKQVSDQFIVDVDAFIKTHFHTDKAHDTLFSLREEIKSLQGMAKVLTLNTHSFTHIRMRLSECWDQIKGEEKERKKERAQQKTLFRQNYDQAMQKLQAFKEAYQTQQITIAEANKQIDQMGVEFRNLELNRDERQHLRDEFNAARKPLHDLMNAEENAKIQLVKDKEIARRNKISELKQQIEELLKNGVNLDGDDLSAQRDAILESIAGASLNKAEKLELERQLKPLRDMIVDKRESSLLSLSDNDREALERLKEVLEQREERRDVIKTQIAQLRKSNGNSGLDFAQAMNYNAQMAAEKDRLDKINQGIEEIEQKIAELEQQKG